MERLSNPSCGFSHQWMPVWAVRRGCGINQAALAALLLLAGHVSSLRITGWGSSIKGHVAKIDSRPALCSVYFGVIGVATLPDACPILARAYLVGLPLSKAVEQPSHGFSCVSLPPGADHSLLARALIR